MRRLIAAWLLGSAVVSFSLQALCYFPLLPRASTRGYCAAPQPLSLIGTAILIAFAGVLGGRNASAEVRESPVWRRALVICVYLVGLFLLFAGISRVSLSAPCAHIGLCGYRDLRIRDVISVAFWVAAAVAIAMGCRSRLPGARVTPELPIGKISKGAA